MRVLYAGSYGNLLTRKDMRTELTRNVNPWPDNPMGHASGDMTPYLYRTSDYGRTWQRLVGPGTAGVRGYAHVIKQDLVNPQLLFLGTEFGLWVSTDGGQNWSRYKGGDFPNVAVRDLAIHPRDHDLVIATHGRGIWIIDDITPLRALTPQTVTRSVAFVMTKPVVQIIGEEKGIHD